MGKRNKWINNTIINKRVSEEELPVFLAQGWLAGPKPQTEETKQRKKEKTIKTNQERYGCDNVFQAESIKAKITSTCLERYSVKNPAKTEEVKEKTKQHFVDVYGVDNPFKSEIIKAQIKQTHINDYGSMEEYYRIRDLHCKQTKLEKHGDENYNNAQQNILTIKAQNPDLEQYYKNRSDKAKATIIKHYGSMENFYQWRYENTDWELAVQRQIETKRKNNSFHTSKAEEELYLQLCKEYGSDNIKRQYDKDLRYPFRCDFYIVSEDKFIEFNRHWTHGGCSFNENDTKCQQQLNEWIEKAKDSNFFKIAIQTWTIRDVLKLKFAHENNLNYEIIW